MNIKRFLSGALCAVLLLALCPAAAADAPCEISSAEELSLLRETPDGDFVLTADIDMTGVKGFKPIASKKAEGFEAKVFPTREEKIAYAFRKGTSGYRIQ